MKAKRLAIAAGVDAEAVARELLRRKPAQARVLMAIHRGHDTALAVARVLDGDTRGINFIAERLASAGYITREWPMDETFDDIPTVTPTGKTMPVRGGSSTRTKGRR
jgi:hypothetical protein